MRIYNRPIDGGNLDQSTIDGRNGQRQLRDYHYQKKALMEAKKEQFFQPLADSTAMPKNSGKTIKRHHYVPMLDDQNVGFLEGIDANGVTYSGPAMYGSSKDIGTISGKYPTLGENGGRFNKVFFKRKVIEGSFEKFGIFDEYNQESMDFDSDSQLMMHINREMVYGASEITEDMLQIDLLNNAGVVKFPGAATSVAEVDETTVTYRDLLRLAIDLTNNRTPTNTKVFTGTRMTDTKTIPGARIMYIGSELQPLLEEMKDLHNERAFIPVQKYAAGGNTVNGEIGTIGYFRIVVVPEMMNHTGGGAAVAGTAEGAAMYSDGSNYNVYPMLVVGDASFTTIGFQTDGKTVKFKIYHKKPGLEMANLEDPYGEKGFMSIKWHYGFMILRPERLAVQWTAGKM